MTVFEENEPGISSQKWKGVENMLNRKGIKVSKQSMFFYLITSYD